MSKLHIQPLFKVRRLQERPHLKVVGSDTVQHFEGENFHKFLRLCGYLQKFSLRNLGAWHLLAAPTSNLRKIFSMKNIFHQLAKVFLCKFFLPTTPTSFLRGKFPHCTELTCIASRAHGAGRFPTSSCAIL